MTSSKLRRVSRVSAPPEDYEQRLVIAYRDRLMPVDPDMKYLVHVPNGGKRDLVSAQLLKAAGVSPGWPALQLALVVPGFHGLAIEMKRREGGRLTVDQYDTLAWLAGNNWLACVCLGADDAIALLDTYRGIRDGKVHREGEFGRVYRFERGSLRAIERPKKRNKSRGL